MMGWTPRWTALPAHGYTVGDMNDRTLGTLEYNKIIVALADRTSFSASRELAEALVPFTDPNAVQRAQSETAEARRVLELRPEITTGGARDVRPAVARADLGGIIEPLDLLTIGATLAAARGMKRIILKLNEVTGEIPLIAGMAHRLEELPEVEDRIRTSVSERGEVLDSASPALGRVRSELRIAHDRLLGLLRSILNSGQYAQAIQDPLIMQREGRYVIPVKADFRARLPGIVHDASNSGQTLFVEPLGAVEAGNRWRELQAREAEEVERVLMELAGVVARYAGELRRTVDALAWIDFSLAKARYANALSGVRPEIVVASKAPRDEPVLRLPQARHPLLRGHVVPISVELGGPYRVLVITGPNTGGKTVALKTVGLLSLMAQSGLQVPAMPGARLPVLQRVYADIGDEQSIEQSLSTFSSHIRNIVGMLGELDADSLVLLDEVGAGTDPEEGSALARAIIDYLLERRCLAVTTTHYSDLKGYAHNTPGVRNASVEFDEASLSPTYRLLVGLPGRSNALSIAGRLGMPRDILERAQERVRPESRELNDLLQQIQDERDAAAQARARVDAEREEARKLADRTRRELQEAEARKADAVDEGRRQAQEELEEFRREMAELRRQLQRAATERAAAGTREAAAQAVAQVQDAEGHLRELTRRASTRTRHVTTATQAPDRPLAPGDTVLLRTLGSTGRVLSIADGSAEVQLGNLKTRVPLDELQLQAPEPQRERGRAGASGRTAGRTRYNVETRSAPPLELDLRGQRAEAVTEQLDRYIDDAYLAGMPMLRIIHGKGTGVLRQIVRDFLSSSPLVESIESGGEKGGGEGVTVATLSNR